MGSVKYHFYAHIGHDAIGAAHDDQRNFVLVSLPLLVCNSDPIEHVDIDVCKCPMSAMCMAQR